MSNVSDRNSRNTVNSRISFNPAKKPGDKNGGKISTATVSTCVPSNRDSQATMGGDGGDNYSDYYSSDDEEEEAAARLSNKQQRNSYNKSYNGTASRLSLNNSVAYRNGSIVSTSMSKGGRISGGEYVKIIYF